MNPKTLAKAVMRSAGLTRQSSMSRYWMDAFRAGPRIHGQLGRIEDGEGDEDALTMRYHDDDNDEEEAEDGRLAGGYP